MKFEVNTKDLVSVLKVAKSLKSREELLGPTRGFYYPWIELRTSGDIVISYYWDGFSFVELYLENVKIIESGSCFIDVKDVLNHIKSSDGKQTTVWATKDLVRFKSDARDEVVFSNHNTPKGYVEPVIEHHYDGFYSADANFIKYYRDNLVDCFYMTKNQPRNGDFRDRCIFTKISKGKLEVSNYAPNSSGIIQHKLSKDAPELELFVVGHVGEALKKATSDKDTFISLNLYKSGMVIATDKCLIYSKAVDAQARDLQQLLKDRKTQLWDERIVTVLDAFLDEVDNKDFEYFTIDDMDNDDFIHFRALSKNGSVKVKRDVKRPRENALNLDSENNQMEIKHFVNAYMFLPEFRFLVSVKPAFDKEDTRTYYAFIMEGEERKSAVVVKSVPNQY